MADIILYVSLAILAIGIIRLLIKKESPNTEIPKASPIITTERPKTKKATKKPTAKKRVEKSSLGRTYVPHIKTYKEKIHLNDIVTTWRKPDSNEVYFYYDREYVGIMESRQLANQVENYKIDGEIVNIAPKQLIINLYYR